MSHENGIFAAAVALHESPISYGHDDDAENAAAIIKAYLDASGMVMVPRVPTDDMVSEGIDVLDGGWNGRTNAPNANSSNLCYNAMITSAPNPFQTPEESREKK